MGFLSHSAEEQTRHVCQGDFNHVHLVSLFCVQAGALVMVELSEVQVKQCIPDDNQPVHDQKGDIKFGCHEQECLITTSRWEMD
jgi:hypothetical protein